jgi:hypothetical protein
VARPGGALLTAIPEEDLMDPQPQAGDSPLEWFRPYLLLLARLDLGGQAPGRLDALPKANHEAVVLRCYEGLSLDEISARQGRTPAAAGLLKRGLGLSPSALHDPE